MDIVPVIDLATCPIRSGGGHHTNIPVIEQIHTGFEMYLPAYSVSRPQGTADWLLLYTTSGHGYFGHAGERVIFEEADLALVRPGTPQEYGLKEGQNYWKQLFFHFLPRPHWQEWLTWPEVLPGVLRLHLGEPIIRQKIISYLWQAHSLCWGGLARQNDFAMNSLEGALLWCDTQNPQTASGRLDSRVLKTMDFLCRNLSEPASSLALSRISGLSASWLSSLFRAQTGLSPAQFLDQQRLVHAKMQLKNSIRPISEIAADVGMDPAYFSHWFKHRAISNPRDYRDKNQQY